MDNKKRGGRTSLQKRNIWNACTGGKGRKMVKGGRGGD